MGNWADTVMSYLSAHDEYEYTAVVVLGGRRETLRPTSEPIIANNDIRGTSNGQLSFYPTELVDCRHTFSSHLRYMRSAHLL